MIVRNIRHYRIHHTYASYLMPSFSLPVYMSVCQWLCLCQSYICLRACVYVCVYAFGRHKPRRTVSRRHIYPTQCTPMPPFRNRSADSLADANCRRHSGREQDRRPAGKSGPVSCLNTADNRRRTTSRNTSCRVPGSRLRDGPRPSPSRVRCHGWHRIRAASHGSR